MHWWSRNNLRLVQTNIREIDGNLDVDRLIATLTDWSANVLMINAGGIVAFYPTRLKYHCRAQGQTKDLLGEVVEKAHRSGLKVIARFDFSKAQEAVFRERPEWFYRTRSGREVNYHGIVHTCVNGGYQQEYSLLILDEVISHYAVDGIFFNMFGYQEFDYSGNWYGMCCCDNCRTRFRGMYGLELPQSDDRSDPAYFAYKQFQEATTREMLDRISALVKGKRPDVAICTYHDHKVDIIRHESNTAIKRAHPVWAYSAAEHVKSTEDSWDDKLASNCCINAIDLPYRFTGVSNHEVAIRLYESLANGSGLDFCIVGTFEGYPDRENLPLVRDIFRYHAENEAYYGQFESVADLALIKPGNPFEKTSAEYLGFFKMLKEEHLQFDVIHQNRLQENRERLRKYKAVLIPDIALLAPADLDLLEQLRGEGVPLLATGESFSGNGENAAFRERVFWVRSVVAAEDTLSSYLATTEKTLFRRFPERDRIILEGWFGRMELVRREIGRLPWIAPSTFGPPERAFGHCESEYAGAAICEAGGALCAYLPWKPGELYYRYGYADHKHVVLDLLDYATKRDYILESNVPEQVELCLNRLDAHTYILHAVNMTGFNGVTYHAAVPVPKPSFTLRVAGFCREALELRSGRRVACESDGHSTTLRPERLDEFAAIVVRMRK